MTKHDLKELAAIGAELGAAKAENEKLRGLLTTLRVSLNLDDTEYGLSQQEKRKLAADIDAELSRQPEPMCETMQRPKAECGCPDCGSSLIDWPTAEPTDTFTAADMATAAAQGFRDGQKAEPAPAQDEREAAAYVECRECTECGHAGINDQADGDSACSHCGWHGSSPEEDKCPECQREGTMSASCPKCGCRYRLIADAEIATRPAQTEQQPGKLLVSADPLRRVLNALVNAPHQIRELQATREPVALFSDNPINILIAEYNAAQGDEQ